MERDSVLLAPLASPIRQGWGVSLSARSQPGRSILKFP